MVEDDVILVLDEHNSGFITHEIQPSTYSFKDPSEVLLLILQSENPGTSNVIDIEFDDIIMKAKLVLRDGIIIIRFNEKLFFLAALGFTPGWDHKHYNELISQKNVNLSTTNKKHLKSEIIDGSLINGIRQPILFGFVLDKPAGYRVFCEPETVHWKKKTNLFWIL